MAAKINAEELPQEVRHLVDKTKKELLMIIHNKQKEIITAKMIVSSKQKEIIALNKRINETTLDDSTTVKNLEDALDLQERRFKALQKDMEGEQNLVVSLREKIEEDAIKLHEATTYVNIWFWGCILIATLLFSVIIYVAS